MLLFFFFRVLSVFFLFFIIIFLFFSFFSPVRVQFIFFTKLFIIFVFHLFLVYLFLTLNKWIPIVKSLFLLIIWLLVVFLVQVVGIDNFLYILISEFDYLPDLRLPILENYLTPRVTFI